MAALTTKTPGGDSALEARIGILLKAGVYSSATVILLGGILYLVRQGYDMPDYSVFHGVPDRLGTLSGIAAGALRAQPLAIMQFGILMLIATPIARVIFSVFAFLAARDYLYVAISTLVLGILAYSLIAL
jgi:uncharacterized membrane protein